MWRGFRPNEGSVKILASRPEQGAIDVDIEWSDGEVGKATIVLDGDRLTLKHREGDGSPDEAPTIVFDRITPAEAERRIVASKNAKSYRTF